MHDLGFTETLYSVKIHILGESKRIEESQRCNCTWKTIARLAGVSYPSVDGSYSRDRLRNKVFGNYRRLLNLSRHGKRRSSIAGYGRSEGTSGTDGCGEDCELHFIL